MVVGLVPHVVSGKEFVEKVVNCPIGQCVVVPADSVPGQRFDSECTKVDGRTTNNQLLELISRNPSAFSCRAKSGTCRHLITPRS